jgi:hypothetical protein
MKLLDTKTYDVLYFNETHLLSTPLDLHGHAKKCGYTRLELAARKFHSAGRGVGGSLVFVRSKL